MNIFVTKERKISSLQFDFLLSFCCYLMLNLKIAVNLTKFDGPIRFLFIHDPVFTFSCSLSIIVYFAFSKQTVNISLQMKFNTTDIVVHGEVQECLYKVLRSTKIWVQYFEFPKPCIMIFILAKKGYLL